MPTLRPAGRQSNAAGLARHAMWNYLAAISSLLSSLAVLALAFRDLSGRDVGVYSVAVTTMAMLGNLDSAVIFAVGRTVAQRVAGLTSPEAALRELAGAQGTLNGLSVGVVSLSGLALVPLIIWVPAALSDRSADVMVGAIVLALAVRLSTALLPAIANGLRDFGATARASAAANVLVVAVAAVTLPTLGVAALGLGQLIGIGASRWLLHRKLRRSALLPPMRRARFARAEFTAVTRSAGAIAALGLAAQLITWADLVLISAFVTAATSGLYRVAVLLPTQACSLIFQGYDVIYPLLARNWPAEQMRFTRLLSTVFGAVSGVVFVTIAWTARDWIFLLTGGHSGMAVDVLRIFCLVWALNIPAHGIVLMLFAQSRQRRLVPLVMAEGLANLALTVVLVLAHGATGAALATLVTLGISNVITLPLVVRRDIPNAVRFIFRYGIMPTACAAAGALSLLVLLQAGFSGWAEFALDLGSACLFSVAVAWLAGGSGGRHALRASFARVTHQG